jgi:ribose 5-phosphate isomerase A
MTVDANLIEREKRMAGEAAAGFVQAGMKVGLGTGSTIYFTIEALGRRWQAGELEGMVAVATSERTTAQASRLGLPVRDLSDVMTLDLTIDGADEVDPAMHLIKGLGGALLREKIVASSGPRMVVVVDSHKLVKRLGTIAPVPVEVDPFGWKATLEKLSRLPGCAPKLRMAADGTPYRTDGGHRIVDCAFAQGIDDPAALERAIQAIPGALECGLFIGIASRVVVGGPERALEMVAGGEIRPLVGPG